jgi:hypothetical protein
VEKQSFKTVYELALFWRTRKKRVKMWKEEKKGFKGIKIMRNKKSFQ